MLSIDLVAYFFEVACATRGRESDQPGEPGATIKCLIAIGKSLSFFGRRTVRFRMRNP